MAEDVTVWLNQHGLGKYADSFEVNEIGVSDLPLLSDDDLRDLGLPLGPRRRFLAAVGTLKVDADASAAASGAHLSAEAAERRQLTVMFCDLVGSTELSQRLDPEDLRDVIAACQDAWKSSIERYDGYIARYMGDGVLAYFGYPHAYEDDAQRAVRAGLGVVAAMAELNTQSMSPGDGDLAVRVGIATGPVVVGDVIGEGASQETVVVGETPNLAARLQGLAQSNCVLVSEATRALVHGWFELRDLGAHEVRGIVAPVHPWQVDGERDAGSRFEVARHEGLTPLVGREDELDLLARRWRRARRGAGQVALLSGEPGLGKSRLAYTVARRAAPEPHWHLQWQCSPYHGDTPLYPAIRELGQSAGFAEDDTEQDKVDKLADLLERSGQSDAQSLGLLAELLSLACDESRALTTMNKQDKRLATLRAIAGRMQGLSRAKPLLLIFEDIHWADPTSLELLDAWSSRRAPCLRCWC